jgi:hypothetical protein
MAKKKQEIVSRAAFADLCGVSRTAVTKACLSTIKPACVGIRIDAAHPAAVKYAQAKELAKKEIPVKPRSKAKKADKKPSGRAAQRANKKAGIQAAGDKMLDISANITDFKDMTLRQLIETYGTDTRFVDWLKATKEIEMINEKRLKNAKTQGELVSRHLVKIGIVDPIEAAHIRLLTAGSKTIAVRLHAMSQAGRSVEDLEAFVVDQISSFIRPVKDKVRRALTNA